MQPAALVVLPSAAAVAQRQDRSTRPARAAQGRHRPRAIVAPRNDLESALVALFGQVLGARAGGRHRRLLPPGRALAARHAAPVEDQRRPRHRVVAASAVRRVDRRAAGRRDRGRAARRASKCPNRQRRRARHDRPRQHPPASRRARGAPRPPLGHDEGGTAAAPAGPLVGSVNARHPARRRAHWAATRPRSRSSASGSSISSSPGPPPTTSGVSVELTGPLDVTALQRGITELTRRHDILRTTFRQNGDAIEQVVAAVPSERARIGRDRRSHSSRGGRMPGGARPTRARRPDARVRPHHWSALPRHACRRQPLQLRPPPDDAPHRVGRMVVGRADP